MGRSSRLLSPEDEAPVIVDNISGSSSFLLLGDHAGRAIPSRLGDMGLAHDDLERHITWDIGVAGLGALLAQRLDCAFIRQRYSRLVIDCNRAPDAPSSIVEASDGSTILGNVGLDGEAKAARRAEIFAPYHAAISAAIAARIAARRPTILFSLHSFTPVWNASARPWRFGILHRNDSAFSHAILARLHAAWPEEVGDNEPYAMDGTDFTIPFHADAHRLDYVELEVRQDLISTEQGQSSVADALAPILVSALAG